EGMGHETLNGTVAFAKLINARAAGHYPVQESGGIATFTTGDGAKGLARWLSLFPGKYAGLSYGGNDAGGCISPTTCYDSDASVLQAVLRAGKAPLVPYVLWGRERNRQRCTPSLNAQISRLYAAYPQIVRGPDFWTFFQQHQDLISSDDIHPTEAG